jgi:hypothetical protein
MAQLFVDLDPSGSKPVQFHGDTAPLVYFMSFAFAARYGAQHELTKAALLLRGGNHRVDLKPLLTFADRGIEDEQDRRELERAWQDPAPLAGCCRRVVGAIDHDAEIRSLLVDFPTLRDRIDELGEAAEHAAEAGQRIRLSFEL